MRNGLVGSGWIEIDSGGWRLKEVLPHEIFEAVPLSSGD